MPRFTLNVDTRANVIRRTHLPSIYFHGPYHLLVSSKLHKLFDSSHWLLLPETSIIDVYYNDRFEFPIIDVCAALRFISYCLEANVT